MHLQAMLSNLYDVCGGYFLTWIGDTNGEEFAKNVTDNLNGVVADVIADGIMEEQHATCHRRRTTNLDIVVF
jgi:hypothetical protein